MTATIMGNATIAFGREKEHLMFPIIRAQRPAVRECNDRTGFGTPVFVVDVCAISGCEKRHDWDLKDVDDENLWMV